MEIRTVTKTQKSALNRSARVTRIPIHFQYSLEVRAGWAASAYSVYASRFEFQNKPPARATTAKRFSKRLRTWSVNVLTKWWVCANNDIVYIYTERRIIRLNYMISDAISPFYGNLSFFAMFHSLLHRVRYTFHAIHICLHTDFCDRFLAKFRFRRMHLHNFCATYDI